MVAALSITHECSQAGTNTVSHTQSYVFSYIHSFVCGYEANSVQSGRPILMRQSNIGPIDDLTSISVRCHMNKAGRRLFKAKIRVISSNIIQKLQLIKLALFQSRKT